MHSYSVDNNLWNKTLSLGDVMTTKFDLYTPRPKLFYNSAPFKSQQYVVNPNISVFIYNGPVLYISDFIKSNTIFEISLSLVNICKSIEGQYFLGVGTNN